MDPSPALPDLLFYDGRCGLCHGLVAFLARRDPGLHFAPLGGATHRARVPPGPSPGQTLVVLHGGRVLVRSAAVLHLLRRVGGPFAVLAFLGGLFPRVLRDGGYDVAARLRNALFRPPETLCPRMPPAFRARFLP